MKTQRNLSSSSLFNTYNKNDSFDSFGPDDEEDKVDSEDEMNFNSSKSQY